MTAPRQIVRIELGPGSQHSFFPSDPREYSRTAFASMGWDLPIDEFFPDRKKLLLSKGDREMTLPELSDRIAELRAQHQPRLEWGRFSVEWHKKFAIPAACLVFGLLGLALSLGSKKEARSSAFALSIAVIFVYYVLIRLGEQAGDTGMMSPWLSMWGANVVLGAIALALLWLNHREAAFDPLDPAHYLSFVPKVRRQREEKPVSPPRGAAAGAPPRPVVVVRIPRLTLRFPSLLDRYIARSWVANVMLVLRRLHVHLLPRGVHGPDRRHPAAQGERAGDLPLLRLPPLADRLHGRPDRGAGGRAGDPRPPRPAQRDHRHEGGRHQRLPRGGAGARDGPPGQPPPLRDAGVDPPHHEQGRGPRPQRHQGPTRPVVRPVRPALGAGERRALLQLRLHRGARGGGRARGGGAGARRRVLGVRLLDLRRGPGGLGPARAALRQSRGLERRLAHLRPRARLAPDDGGAVGRSGPSPPSACG